MGAPLGNSFECEARERKRAAGLACFVHRPIEVAPESMDLQQAGMRINLAFALERFEHAFELVFEGLEPNEGKNTLDQWQGAPLCPNEIGQPLVVTAIVVEHADRQIAEAGIFGEHPKQGIDCASAEPV